jgi:hypothetical protein
METTVRPEAYYQFKMESYYDIGESNGEPIKEVKQHVVAIELGDNKLKVYDKWHNLDEQVQESVNDRVNEEVVVGTVKETKTGLHLVESNKHIGWEKLCEKVREIINFEVDNYGR